MKFCTAVHTKLASLVVFFSTTYAKHDALLGRKAVMKVTEIISPRYYYTDKPTKCNSLTKIGSGIQVSDMERDGIPLTLDLAG